MGLAQSAVEYTRRGIAVFPLAVGKKHPVKSSNGLKDATTNDYGFLDKWGEHNIGAATGQISGNVVVIDCDNDELSGKDGYGTLRRWESEHGEFPETWTTITPRGGYHFWYRLPAGVTFRNSANEDLAVDIRGDGGYVVVPPSRLPNGCYEWENDPDDYPMAIADENVLEFIRHVQKGVVATQGEKFKLPAVIPAGKRHDTLVRYIAQLQSRDYDDDMIWDLLQVANKRCKPTYSERELEELYSDLMKRFTKGLSDEAKSLVSNNQKKTAAAITAEISDDIAPVLIDGAPCIWDGLRWKVGIRALDKAIKDSVGTLSRSKRRDMREDMLLDAEEVGSADPRYIAFRNGVVDITDIKMELKPYDRDMRIINVIPHDFDVNAESEVVDRFLDTVSCGDRSVRQSMEEVVGLCMWRSCEFAKCPILLGSGSNGKSTFIRALRYLLGKENVSSLDLKILGQHFQGQRIMGKLANIGDDISNERIPGDVAAEWKKMVTGERIYSDVKGSDGVEFTPYATLVFSANEMPSLGDSSDGMMRRLMPIPFDADFENGDVPKDPHIARRLETEDAASYLALLGVMALFMMVKRGGVTEIERTKDMVSQIKMNNSTILQWIDAVGMDTEHILGKVTSDVYRDYNQWCFENGVRPYGSNYFGKACCSLFGVSSVPAGRNIEGKRIRVYANQP